MPQHGGPRMNDITGTETKKRVIEDVDLVVVGGGKAGKTLAMDSARAGQKVAMIECSKIGDTCINVACIPTKTIINSGRVMKCGLRATEFGITGVDNDLLGARAEKIGRNTDGTVTMSLATGNSVTADDILVAVGRDPVTTESISKVLA
jgi:pyruvate/2-oxoglutarate dehydrogenase complex dihydrolipoamide dehydrogenase (E3) component